MCTGADGGAPCRGSRRDFSVDTVHTQRSSRGGGGPGGQTRSGRGCQAARDEQGACVCERRAPRPGGSDVRLAPLQAALLSVARLSPL